MSTVDLAALTARLAERACEFEADATWPKASLDVYAEMQGPRWGVPPEYGGTEMPIVDRLRGYMALARGDMSTALFVTQHEGAVDLLAACENEQLKRTWLPRFALGDALTTIGYSQLTTSRLGGQPAMRAVPVDGGFRLHGIMPWVTGASHVDNVVCGAALDDGRQILALLALDRLGVHIHTPERLAALNSTATCEVSCDGVFTYLADIIAGPVENVLSVRSALRLLLVSATGVGLALGMTDALSKLDEEAATLAGARAQALEQNVLALAANPTLNQASIDQVRAEINSWLVRLAGLIMLAAKGTGYRRSASAQRLANEALFFCVWSASSNVREETRVQLIG